MEKLLSKNCSLCKRITDKFLFHKNQICLQVTAILTSLLCTWHNLVFYHCYLAVHTKILAFSENLMHKRIKFRINLS